MSIVIVTDDFNRANEGPPMTNWVDQSGASRGFKVSSNAAVPENPTAGFNRGSVYSGTVTWPNDQYSQGKLALGAAGSIGLCVRAQYPTITHYQMMANHAGSNNIEFKRIVADVDTDLLAFTQAWVDGDTFKFTVDGVLLFTRLRLFLNGTQVGTTYFDTSAFSLVGGKPGLFFATDGSATTASVDDWEGGGEEAVCVADEARFPKFLLQPVITGGRVI